MTTTCQQQLQTYLFEPVPSFDIHHSTFRCISRTILKNFRILAWIMITIIIILLQRVNYTFFANVKFLSNQGLILTWLYFGLATQHNLLNRGQPQAGKQICPKIKYIVEVLFELALCFEVPITILEWTMLYKQQLKRQTKEQLLVQVLEHSVPIVLLLIDLTCNCCRFLAKRLFLVVAYALAYLVINLSYSVTVKPVYSIITWLNLRSYISVTAVTIMILATHLLARKIFTTFKQPNLQALALVSPNARPSGNYTKSEEDSN